MPSRPGFALGLVLFAALILIASVPFWAILPSADSASSVVVPEVRERALREGRIRVIAEVRLPSGQHVPEGMLSGAALSLQRNDIASVRNQVLARLAGRTHRVLRQYGSVPLLALEVGPDALTELEASSLLVRRVVEDTVNAPTLPQSVPLIGADQLWNKGFDGTGVVVAIVDTGVEASHPFLAGKVVEEACYSSTATGVSLTMCPNGQSQQTGPGAGASCPLSSCWHGTHVAGIAAGNGGSAGVTFSGVAKGAQIMAVQVFSQFIRASDCGGSAPCALAYTSDIIAGLERVYAVRATRNLSSANLSLGGGLSTSPCDGDPTKAIIDNLRSVGIATAVAAGNNGSTNSVSAPGCISTAVSVGATTKSDVIASYSNMASFVSLLAPGSSIYSSITGGAFGTASGTSMATPHVTGTWAVLKQAVPGASVSQILSALQATGILIADTRSGGTATKPRIQVDQALAALVPSVGSVSPNQGAPAAVVPVTINGTGFVSGSTVSLNPTGVTASNVSFVSATQLTATLTVAAGAATGGRDLTVTNPNGGSGTLTGAFSVAVPSIAITSVTPNQGAPGATVPVTITGSGFTAGTTVALSGAGVSASNVSIASATQLTVTLTIASGAALGPRDITVTNSGGSSATMTAGFTVVAPVTGSASLSLAYNGQVRDRVGQGESALGPDGAPDGTLTATLSASGGRTITALRLTSDAPGLWRTSSPGTGNWVLGVATSFDGALLNAAGSLAVNFAVADGGSFVVFAADYQGGEFLPGRTLTLTATFSDGSTASASTVVPETPAALTLAYNGKLRDRVGQGESALGPDGAPDGTLTATLSASGGRTITTLRLTSDAPGLWRTSSPGTGNWVLGVATSLDGALLNAAGSMAVNFAVADGGSFVVFAADYQGGEFLPGRTLTLTATFSDGSTASASIAVPGTQVALTLAYNGKLRDRVGQGESALGPDGAPDGTLTATLSASGGRTITALRLNSDWPTAPGIWRTSSPGTGNWVLGVATSLDGALLNAAGSMAVNFAIADGGSFVVFAADYQGGEFLSGRTLTLTATFSDGSTAVASTNAP